jgi:hypothetical protein
MCGTLHDLPKRDAQHSNLHSPWANIDRDKSLNPARRRERMIESPVVSISTDENKKLELRLRLVKDEIAAQANTFDQIDTKTGVALGFTFVSSRPSARRSF